MLLKKVFSSLDSTVGRVEFWLSFWQAAWVGTVIQRLEDRRTLNLGLTPGERDHGVC